MAFTVVSMVLMYYNGIIGMYGSSASLQILQALLITATTTTTSPEAIPIVSTPVEATLITT